MTIPTLITDLSTTVASNFPQGGDSPSTLDDVQRAHGAFIAKLRDNPTENATTATPVAKGGTGSTTGASALVALGERTAATGSAIVPAGTTAQRDGSPVFGYQRANSTTGTMEWWSGTAWTGLGGGANNLTQANGVNVLAGTGQSLVGPITIPTGQTLSVAPGARLVIL